MKVQLSVSSLHSSFPRSLDFQGGEKDTASLEMQLSDSYLL